MPNADTIAPDRFSVDVIDCYKSAKPFVLSHHYSGSFPASRLSLGLFENGKGGTSALVGVCVFSVPVNNASVKKYTGLGYHRQACDLGRFVLLDSVAGNGETYFLSRALKQLRMNKPEILSVISYADPVRRIGADGSLIMPGHIGAIYRDMGNALYRGRAKPRINHYTPDGQLFSERALSKIANRETGFAYAVDELKARNAPAPPNDDLAAWIKSLKSSGFLTGRRHAGNHVYNFALTKAAKLAQRAIDRYPFPALDRNPATLDVTALPLLGSTIPITEMPLRLPATRGGGNCPSPSN